MPWIRTVRPIGLTPGNSFCARSYPSTTTVVPAFDSWGVNARPSAILRFMMSKYRSVAPSSVMSLATLPLYSTLPRSSRSEEHTSELQSLAYLVCRLLLEKKNKVQSKFHCLLDNNHHKLFCTRPEIL